MPGMTNGNTANEPTATSGDDTAPQPDVEPERTEHPSGEKQAQENRENEPPG
jgi:hypothetical protein